jgi:arylsulfatase A-like enzyme
MLRPTLALATILALGLSVAFGSERKPNLIVIMADDLGYGDLGCYGASANAVQTPNIDRLAAGGLRFTSGYASASTCTPTRFSFLTGTYAFRQAGTGIASPNSPAIIRPGTETIASVLKRAGYATAVIGKWHLGLGEKAPDWNGALKPGPLEIGFDHCFVLPTTNDRVPQVYVQDHRVFNLDPSDPLWVGDEAPPNHPTGLTHRNTLRMDWSRGHNQTIHNGISRIGFYTGGHAARFRDEDLADAWIKRSVAWIEDNRERPFFLFFASHDIHAPRMPHERFQGKSSLGFRGDSIVEFDWSVGEIVATIERLGLAKDTLIVLCSDNGPVLDDGYKDGAVEKNGDHRSAGPHSGGKYGILEGGTCTPFITYWPGRIAPGVSDLVVSTIDLPASAATLAGTKLPRQIFPDSRDVLAAMLGRPDAVGRGPLLQQGNFGNNLGLRVGDWKLLRQRPRSSENRQPTALPEDKYRLYALNNDPSESRDVAAQHPEIVQDLRMQMDALIAGPALRLVLEPSAAR